MIPGDHNPPHFHAQVGSDEVQVAVESLLIIEGRLSRRYERELRAWARQHHAELRRAWAQASNNQQPDPID